MSDRFTFNLQTVKPLDERTLVSSLAAIPSTFQPPKVKYVPSAFQTIVVPELIANSSPKTAEVQAAVEEVVEDNDEKAWETFLELEEQYSNTNRWLAE